MTMKKTYPLITIKKTLSHQITDDKYLRSAGGYNDWPIGRGIFMNKAKNCYYTGEKTFNMLCNKNKLNK